jgi:hypothetical protein
MEPMFAKPTDRSARIKAPCWGLLGMIVMVALLERFGFRNNVDFASAVVVSWRFKDVPIAPRAKGCDVLCFGDSFVQLGVLPRVIRERTGRRAYNFAIHSGSSPSSCFLLRRAIESGATPSLVIVDFARDILAEGPASITRPYPWADLLNKHEMIDLSWAARDPDLIAMFTLGRILPSLRVRYEVRASVLSALTGQETGQRLMNLGLLRNWNRNAGAQVVQKHPNVHRDPAPPAGPPGVGNWRPDPVNALYVEKFLRLAASHGINVVWLLPPCSPWVQALWDHSGDEAIFDRFIRETEARHTNLVVLDARRAGFPAEVFFDGIHLDRDGALALSAGIADFLITHPKTAELASRHTALRDYLPHPIDIPLEDLAQSAAIVPVQTRRR